MVEIDRQIENRVAGIMRGLESELLALKVSNDDRLARLSEAKDQNRIAAEKGQRYLEVTKKLEQQLQEWQRSVLNSLTGADY